MRHGKRGERRYAPGLVDGFALVALDQRRVAYLKPGPIILQIPASGSRQARPRAFEDFPFRGLL
jgi:hypothetical protein